MNGARIAIWHPLLFTTVFRITVILIICAMLPRQMAKGQESGVQEMRETRTYSVFSLDSDPDLKFWQDQLSSLGFQPKRIIKNETISESDFRNVFSEGATWLTIGGHFEKGFWHSGGEEGDRVEVRFDPDRVELKTKKGTEVIIKGDGFNAHENVQVIFLRGCVTLEDEEVVQNMRALFSNKGEYPILIGWTGKIGWQVHQAVYGGFGNEHPMPQYDFFDRFKASGETNDQIIKSWVDAVASTFWGAGSVVERSVACIDSDGVEWTIKGGRLAPSGRKF